MVYKLARIGLTDSEIMDILNCDKETFRRWQRDAEFRRILDMGREEAGNLVKVALVKRLLGYKVWEITYEADIHIDPETKEKYLLDPEMVITKTVEKEVLASDTLLMWYLEKALPNEFGKKSDNGDPTKAPVFIVPTFDRNQLLVTDEINKNINEALGSAQKINHTVVNTKPIK